MRELFDNDKWLKNEFAAHLNLLPVAGSTTPTTAGSTACKDFRQILLEHGHGFIVHSSSAAVGPHQLVRLPHCTLRNAVSFVDVTSLNPAKQVGDFRQWDNATPSLHRHYYGFNTTTSSSAPCRGIGTLPHGACHCHFPLHPRQGSRVPITPAGKR
jgi:hypothetical protein